MKLSKKRADAIYKAVDGPLMDLRVEVARLTNGTEVGKRLDDMLSRAQMEAANGAVRAARGEDADKQGKR